MSPLEDTPPSPEPFRPSTPFMFAHRAYTERMQGTASVGVGHDEQTQPRHIVLADPDWHADADDEVEDEPVHYTTGTIRGSDTSPQLPAPPGLPSPTQEHGHRARSPITPFLAPEKVANMQTWVALWAERYSQIPAESSPRTTVLPNLPPAEIGSDSHYYARPVYPAIPEAQSSLHRTPTTSSNVRKRKATSPPPIEKDQDQDQDQEEAEEDVDGKGKKQKPAEVEKLERAERAKRRRNSKADKLDEMRDLMDDPEVFRLSENEFLRRVCLHMANSKKEVAEGRKHAVCSTAQLRTVRRQSSEMSAMLTRAVAAIKKINALRRERTDDAR